MRNWSVILQMPRWRFRYVVLRTPYSIIVCYLFCLEWAFSYSHDSCARIVLGLLGLLASPFHGKLNLTSMNWPPAGPFLPLPLSCQGLNFTSMGHSGPRWISLVGLWLDCIVDLCNFFYFSLFFFSHTIPSSWIHRLVYRYILVTEYYPCWASTIWPVNLVLSTMNQ